MRNRDLFRAIVLSGSAVVAASCSSTPAVVDAGRDAPMTPEVDSGPGLVDTGTDAPLLADAGPDTGIPSTDAGPAVDANEDAGEDAMVLIL